MLSPVSIEFEGFRSFKNRAFIQFPQGNAAMLVSGRYSDSDVSSGSGKSTVLIAIAYAMGFKAPPATELLNWDSEKLYVQFVLTDGTRQIKITRDPKLKLEIEGEKSLSGKAAQERLEALIKTNPDLAQALTYRVQRERGKFINSTDLQKKEFLSSLLGLTEIENAHEALSKEYDGYKTKKDGYQREIDFGRTSLPSLLVPEADFEICKKAYEEAQAKVRQFNNSEAVAKIQSELVQVRAEITKNRNVQRENDRLKNETMQLRNAVMALNNELTVLKSQTCPTCQREWDSAQNLIAAKEKQLQDWVEKIKQNATYNKNAQPLIDAIPALEERDRTLCAQYAQIVGPQGDAERALQSATFNLQTLTKKREDYKRMELAITQREDAIKALEKDMEATEHAMNLLSRNGFLGAIFDEILIDIESRTNEMMGYIPNVSRFTVSIESTKVAKNGNVSKSINVTVFENGKERNLKESLSGGQQAAIEFCTDLAVMEAVRSRSGSPLSWICLDEAMDGLDNTTKKFALDIIKQKVKGLILVVDHSTEIKESFESVVQVVFDGKYSTLLSA